MANMKFTIKEKEKKQPGVAINIPLTAEEYERVDQFVKKHGMSKKELFREVVKKELDERDVINIDDEWQDEPFLLSDAARRWNMSLTNLKVRLFGKKWNGQRYSGSFRANEYKKLNEKQGWIVTRRGMNRVFAGNLRFTENKEVEKNEI